MKVWSIILAMAGVALMVFAFIPYVSTTADVYDAGGCAGKEYPCVDVTVYGRVVWSGKQEVTNVIMGIRLPGGEGSGYSIATYADSDGSFRFNHVPAWLEIAAPYEHYEGYVTARGEHGQEVTQTYWYTKSGSGITHSSNWVSGNLYNMNLPMTTEPFEPGEEPPVRQGEDGSGGEAAATEPLCGVFILGLILLFVAIVTMRGF